MIEVKSIHAINYDDFEIALNRHLHLLYINGYEVKDIKYSEDDQNISALIIFKWDAERAKTLE